MNTDGLEPDLRRLSGRFRWIEQIVAPDAPGFVFCGGELCADDIGLPGGPWPVASLSGKGVTIDDALAACVAEGAEHLSRLEWGSETVCRGGLEAVDHGHDKSTLEHIANRLDLDGVDAEVDLAWIAAHRLSDNTRVLLPADLCLRRTARDTGTVPPSAISTGCAAGRNLDDATRRALLELIERDAVALWWVGGVKPRAVSLEALAQFGAIDLLTRLRGGQTKRTTWVLDIESDIGIPCFAALSLDRQGSGFAVGIAADIEAESAIRGALLELCQSELGHHLVAAKRASRGAASLNDADLRKASRDRAFVAAVADELSGQVPNARTPGKPETVERLLDSLLHSGSKPILVDLTRPEIGVSVARVVVPDLQPYPSNIITNRLAQVMRRCGRDPEKPSSLSLF